MLSQATAALENQVYSTSQLPSSDFLASPRGLTQKSMSVHRHSAGAVAQGETRRLNRAPRFPLRAS